MKKFITSLFIGLGLTTASFAAGTGFGQPALQVGSVNLTGYPVVLSSNNIKIASITILSTNSTLVRFYDTYRTNAPYYGTNYVVGSFVSTSAYATNIATSYVGYNGYTNYYTNTAWATVMVTNAASTNALPEQGTFAVIPNVVATYSASMLFSQGATVWCPTNATLIYYYTANQ